MPKSASTLQSQISTCENNIEEAFTECVVGANNQDVSFSFSLKDFVNGITTCKIDETSTTITQAIDMFQQCEKILALEKKRREYRKELKKVLKAREKKEEVKRLTRNIQFKKKANPMKIPTPPESDASDKIEEIEELK